MNDVISPSNEILFNRDISFCLSTILISLPYKDCSFSAFGIVVGSKLNPVITADGGYSNCILMYRPARKNISSMKSKSRSGFEISITNVAVFNKPIEWSPTDIFALEI